MRLYEAADRTLSHDPCWHQSLTRSICPFTRRLVMPTSAEQVKAEGSATFLRRPRCRAAMTRTFLRAGRMTLHLFAGLYATWPACWQAWCNRISLLESRMVQAQTLIHRGSNENSNLSCETQTRTDTSHVRLCSSWINYSYCPSTQTWHQTNQKCTDGHNLRKQINKTWFSSFCFWMVWPHRCSKGRKNCFYFQFDF